MYSLVIGHTCMIGLTKSNSSPVRLLVVKVLQQLKYWFIVMITMHTRMSQHREKVHTLSVNVGRVSHMANQFMPAAIKNC